MRRDDVDMFEGVESADKDPAQVAARRRRGDARAGTRRGVPRGDGVEHQLQHGVDVDLRAAADVRVPRPARPRESTGRARHALPYHVVGSDAVGRRAPGRLGGAQLEAGRPGHGPLQLRRRPGPVGPRRLDARRQPADLGVRDELRRPRRPERRQGQPADAEADPPHVGGGGGQRAVQLDVSYRMLVGAARRPDEAGRQRARLGRHRRHRRLRRAVRAQRRRHADRRGVVAGHGPTLLNAHGVRGGDRPPGRGLPVLVRRAHPGRVRVAPVRQEDPRARWRRGSRHRVRASRSFDDGRVGVRRQAGRHGRHVRGDVGLHGRVRQPPLLDEAEAADRLATSPTTPRRTPPTA